MNVKIYFLVTLAVSVVISTLINILIMKVVTEKAANETKKNRKEFLKNSRKIN